MIRANCRARFTAADFDFIVRTLARSQTDQVSLVDLLSDVETRDSILDDPRDAGAGVPASSACRELLAFHQWNFSREYTAAQSARRTGYRVLRAGGPDELSTCCLTRHCAPVRTG